MKVDLISNGFFELVCDASFSLLKAREIKNEYEENRYSRSSILSSALCIESFSNCLINTLILPKSTFDALDRLPTLKKIDVYLEFVEEKPLNRGKVEYQKANEIVRLRNDFVHVKNVKNKGNFAGHVEIQKRRFRDVPESDIVLDVASWPTLGFVKNPLAWRASDAHTVLSAICDFFTGVVGDLKLINQNNVRNNLASRLELNEVGAAILSQHVHGEIERLTDVGIDFTFLTETN